MTVREMLASLQHLPRGAEVLAFEAGCEEYCEREVDEVEWQGGRGGVVEGLIIAVVSPLSSSSKL